MLPTSLLAVHWDGAAWRLARAPALPDHRGWIHAANGSSANDVWAVGGTLHPGTYGEEGLAFHWEGASWRRVTIPHVNGEDDLFDVEALGPNDAWTVGRRGVSPYRTLAMSWDGVVWTTVPSPSTKGDSELNAVAAAGPEDVWAVGSAHADGEFEPTTPLIEHWDGTRWSIAATPDTRGESTLWDVFALASNDVWAVGEEDVDGDDHAALLWHWDGAQWAEQALPRGPRLFGLDRLSQGSAGSLWARGQDQSFSSVFFRFDSSWQLAGSQRFIDMYELGVIAATQDDRLLVAARCRPTRCRPRRSCARSADPPTMSKGPGERQASRQLEELTGQGWRRWFRPGRVGLALIGAGVVATLVAANWWFSSEPCRSPQAAIRLDARYPLLLAAGCLAFGWGLVLCLKGRARRWVGIYVAIMSPVIVLAALSLSNAISHLRCRAASLQVSAANPLVTLPTAWTRWDLATAPADVSARRFAAVRTVRLTSAPIRPASTAAGASASRSTRRGFSRSRNFVTSTWCPRSRCASTTTGPRGPGASPARR